MIGRKMPICVRVAVSLALLLRATLRIGPGTSLSLKSEAVGWRGYIVHLFRRHARQIAVVDPC
jgi:hypothetical protein